MNVKNLLNISITFVLLSILAPTFVYADGDSSQGLPEESTDVIPQILTQQLGSGYVLESGAYRLYCSPGSKWNTNCNYQVSSAQCPAGYHPEAVVAPVWQAYRADNALRGYFLSQDENAPTGPFIPTSNSSGGYNLSFYYAYADYVGAENQYVTISYSIYCLPPGG